MTTIIDVNSSGASHAATNTTPHSISDDFIANKLS